MLGLIFSEQDFYFFFPLNWRDKGTQGFELVSR
jgi:hypothetical protein